MTLTVERRPPTAGSAPSPQRPMPSADTGEPAAGLHSQPAMALAELVRIEGEIRALKTLAELDLHCVNEVGAVLPCAQALFFRRSAAWGVRDEAGDNARRSAGLGWRLHAAASLSGVQSDAPLVRWLEDLASRLGGSDRHEGLADKAVRTFVVAEHADLGDPSAQHMPLPHGLWLLLRDTHGRVNAALMLLAPSAWSDASDIVARRVASAYEHAQWAIAGRTAPLPWRDRWRARVTKPWLAASALALAAMLVMPVSLTTVAPVEVVPSEPFVIAAATPAVVERLLVQPGVSVTAGMPLVQLVDASLRNEFELARQRLEVARARALRVQQAAVDDAAAKRDLVIAQAEQAVAQAELDHAQAMLSKAVLSADIDGVALFGDARDWMGRPVAVGEAILRVADAGKAEFQLRVPVADAVNVRVGLPVEIVLDADPFETRTARITRVAYKAEVDAAGIAAFIVTAQPDKRSTTVPQLGLRGTAHIRGEDVSLAYYLFRRPLTALRQMFGV